MTVVASTELGQGRVVIVGSGKDPQEVVDAIDAKAESLGLVHPEKFTNQDTETGLFTERVTYSRSTR